MTEAGYEHLHFNEDGDADCHVEEGDLGVTVASDMLGSKTELLIHLLDVVLVD